jgi:hypothetical protein
LGTGARRGLRKQTSRVQMRGHHERTKAIVLQYSRSWAPPRRQVLHHSEVRDRHTRQPNPRPKLLSVCSVEPIPPHKLHICTMQSAAGLPPAAACHASISSAQVGLRACVGRYPAPHIRSTLSAVCGGQRQNRDVATDPLSFCRLT